MSPFKRGLIVNADDFGRSGGINRGVAKAFEEGILTSASLMVRWPAAADAAAYAREHQALSVGLHFDLSEWCYLDGWRPVYRVVPDELEETIGQELERQLDEFLRLLGRPPTHLDSHQHVHREEPTRSALMAAGTRLGVPVRMCSSRVRYCGAFYGQTSTGEPYPGGIGLNFLLELIAGLPDGVTELACHPAIRPEMGASYAVERPRELAVLCDPKLRDAIDAAGVRLISFGALGDLVAGIMTAEDLRVVALLSTYNEERFIEGCLEHLVRNGVEIYLMDNCSTDDTVGIAERYLGRGLIGIEQLPRHGVYSWRPILERKQQLGYELEGDWFIHIDADERHLGPAESTSLRAALGEVDRQGYNAVCFQEFTFVPTREEPDHDHPEYERTMRWYYPFRPRPPIARKLARVPEAKRLRERGSPHRMNAWKKQPTPVDLASSAGHVVSFPQRRAYERSFPMVHYLFLSVDHATRKYAERRYDEREVAAGWHGSRARLRPADIMLQSQDELRCRTGVALDATAPLTRHPLFSGHG